VKKYSFQLILKQLLQETSQYVKDGVLIGNFLGVPKFCLIWNHELQMLNSFQAVVSSVRSVNGFTTKL
jgi:hypothetical protein